MRNLYIWLNILLELSFLWSCAICMKFSKFVSQQNKVLNHARVKRGWQWESLNVLEEKEVEQKLYVGQLKSDSDKQDGSIKYILSGEGTGNIFTMEEDSGKIFVHRKLDREEKSFYTLRAQAINRLTGVLVETESEFVIKILDINDNKPKFIHGPYIAEVPEMSPIGTSIIQVTAVDNDDPAAANNARLVYSILQGQAHFSIEIKSGIIRVASQIDRETKDHYHVIVQVKDMIGNAGALSATATVTIQVSDINDNAPKFQQKIYDMSIIESASVGEIVGVVLADDIDLGKNAEITYSIEEKGHFSMFNITTDNITQEGIITLNKLVDFERTIRRYHIQVRAENKYKSELNDTATIRVYVVDVDEPPVFLRKEYYMEILENATVGSHVGTVTAKDPDIANRIIRYEILQNSYSSSFEIFSNNGSIITSKPLDRETDPWHNITIAATEAQHLAHVSVVEVYIQVIDVNDHFPELQNEYDIYVCEKTKAGEHVQTISAFDKDPVIGHQFYYMIPPEEISNANFTLIDNTDNTATILTLRNGYSLQETPIFYLPVIISDNGIPSLSSTSTLTIQVCNCGTNNDKGFCRRRGLFWIFLNSGAFIAISVFSIILLGLAVIVHIKCQKSPAHFTEKGEDLKENIVKYDDEGGGEEDTEAFDITGLRHKTVMRKHKRKRIIRNDIQSMYRLSLGLGPDVTIFREFLSEKLEEADTDPCSLPPDSLHKYTYEGTGSTTGSLSSLDLSTVDIDPCLENYQGWTHE
ncbi:PREDICTED: cadherin-19-like [Nanorana parkeri]|uniref:cadherin-19-like n=1 Tax=Nanorana parkeri TaxID=125878 RepID=UPI000854337A|nr:PREDICTED: cadherin-19-like [Nanorana parkeri]